MCNNYQLCGLIILHYVDKESKMLTKSHTNNLISLMKFAKESISVLCIAFISSVLKNFVVENKLEEIQNVECEADIVKNLVKTITEMNDCHIYDALTKFYMDIRDHLVDLLNSFPVDDDLVNENGAPVRLSFGVI